MTQNRAKFILILFLALLATRCYSISPPYPSKLPWFTGPLLTQSARVVPKGHANIEPYLFYTVYPGRYGLDWRPIKRPNFYEVTLQFVYKIGILDRINLGGSVQGFYNWTRGQYAFAFGDLPLGLDFELYKGTNFFAKFSVQETFPTGIYDGLNPKKFETEAGGFGSYFTQFAITVAHLKKFTEVNYLSTRLSVALLCPSGVSVKGLSVYGGDPTTRGRVHPGTTLTIFSAAEYSLTKNWALALDLVAGWSAKTTFSGRTIAPVGSLYAVQFSAAPAIEYNWNEDMGLIVGSWFTFAGRNSLRFINLVAAFNYNL